MKPLSPLNIRGGSYETIFEKMEMGSDRNYAPWQGVRPCHNLDEVTR